MNFDWSIDAEVVANVLERISDGFVALNHDWRFTAVNGRACEIIGKGRDEILGHEIWSVVPETVGTRLETELQRAARDQETILFEYFDPVRRRWYELRLYPSVDGMTILVADVTRRRQDQEDLRRAKESLEQADRRKDEFLAVLSHELRNPLASIVAGAQLLHHLSPSAPEWRATGDMIGQEARQLSALVDDLLDVSRITAGTIVLHSMQVDLRDAVRHAVESARPLMQSRQHELLLDLPASPVHIHGDSVRIVGVLSNLLTNAAKYTPAAGTIRLTLEAARGQAWLRVADNGIGIAADDLSRIFDLFYRIEHEREPATSSLGIGLTVSRRVIAMHKGSLEAFSEGPGRGSEFVVRLPLAKATAARERVSLAPGPAQRPLRRRVLLVDDNVSLATAMSRLLRAMGHEVQAIHDGSGAVATVRSQRPEVVLLDIAMPGRGGYEIAREIRADPDLGAILLVAMTGFGQEEDKQEARAAGFDHHLTKPVDERTLDALLAAR